MQTDRNNRYLYDSMLKRTHLCHPLLFHILRLNRDGEDVAAWIRNLDDRPVEISGVGCFTKKEILYYYQKYLLLLENGYFAGINREKQLSGTIKPEIVEHNLANMKQVLFEVTDRCNLDCEYCGYGTFYSDYDQREDKNLDIRYARQLLDFLVKLWNSPLNNSHERTIFISFYGGEPLLNFPLIKELIHYIEQLNVPRHRIAYSMTTNAILLEKYMDFLVEKEFKLLLSLDGNEENTAYRRLKNGRPAYASILENIEALRNKYPDFFRRNVNFNAVLHNKNSVADIYYYFKTHFDKIPTIGELNSTGITESRKEEFRSTYANVYESLQQSEDYRPIEKDMFIKLPEADDALKFLHFGSDFCFTDYNGLLYSSDEMVRPPTGTCTPFSKKIFVTVNGKMLPCERIGQQFSLGTVNSEGVHLDYDNIAKIFNTYFEKVRKQCFSCHIANTCQQCIFTLDTLNDKNTVCPGFMPNEVYTRFLSSIIGYLEKQPENHWKILRGVTVD